MTWDNEPTGLDDVVAAIEENRIATVENLESIREAIEKTGIMLAALAKATQTPPKNTHLEVNGPANIITLLDAFKFLPGEETNDLKVLFLAIHNQCWRTVHYMRAIEAVKVPMWHDQGAYTPKEKA